MNELHDKTQLEYYMKLHHFTSIFEQDGLPFRLYQYEKGEIMNHIHASADYLKFLVSGTIQIYAIRWDGSCYPIGQSSGFLLLGDIEFCGENTLALMVEAVTEVHCLELPMKKYQKLLLNDNRFLRFVMYSMAHKMAMFAKSEAIFPNLEEKFLHYLKYECKDQQFSGVEDTAFQLRCSRRQLQRILAKLTAEGVISKSTKGTYRLSTDPELL